MLWLDLFTNTIFELRLTKPLYLTKNKSTIQPIRLIESVQPNLRFFEPP